MKTDYAAHDARYVALRAGGAAGWDDDPFRLAELSWALDGVEPGHLLELGCGAGNIAQSLVDRGFTVTGLDISPAAIAWATERAGSVARFVVGDAVAAIPGVYDLVLDSHCLHCIIGSDRQRLLGNVHRALAPRGKLFVSTMCGAITIPALRATFDFATRCQVVDGIARRYIGEPRAILEEIEEAGFEILRSKIRERTGDDDQDHLWALAVKSGNRGTSPTSSKESSPGQ